MRKCWVNVYVDSSGRQHFGPSYVTRLAALDDAILYENCIGIWRVTMKQEPRHDR